MNTIKANQKQLEALADVSFRDMQKIFKKHGEPDLALGEWTKNTVEDAPDYYKIGLALAGYRYCIGKLYPQIGDVEQDMLRRYYWLGKNDGKFIMKFLKWLRKRNLFGDIHSLITDEAERKECTKNWNTKNDAGFFLSLRENVQSALINKYLEENPGNNEKYQVQYNVAFD